MHYEMTFSILSIRWFKQVGISACLMCLLSCDKIWADDGQIEERKIVVATIQDLKFHMNSGKISFTEKGVPYELFPPSGTRESRINIATKLLGELRRASHLSVKVYLNSKGETIIQPNSWVFHYGTKN